MRSIFKPSLWLFLAAASVRAADPIVSVSTIPVTSSTEPVHAWRQMVNTAFGPNEELDFDIRWGVVKAGTSSLNIDGLVDVDGRPAYHLVSEAHSTGVVDTFYKVNDRNEAWLDQASLISVRYSKQLREGSFKEDDLVILDQVAGEWTRTTERLDKKTKKTKSGPLPPDTLDVQSSLYVMRTMPMVVGASYRIDVHSGDKIYPLVVKVKRREKVKVPAGTFDCFLVEPLLRGPGMFVSKGKKLDVWLTADDRHMPVRMRSEVFFGHVAAELTHYSPQ